MDKLTSSIIKFSGRTLDHEEDHKNDRNVDSNNANKTG